METLLTKSNLLINEISPIIAVGPEDQSNKRWSGSWIMSDVALEHAHSLQSLMEIGNFTSAFSILRLQFDALTRSVWLLWGATDSKVERIMQDLTNDTANADNGLPSHVDMIKQIEKSAPAEATRLLKEFREVTWKASSSFVHGGIHAMKRHSEGYPVILVKQIIISSNGLIMVTAVHLATLTGNEHVTNDIIRIRDKYRDVLPKLNL
jgi:hypothetical protein